MIQIPRQLHNHRFIKTREKVPLEQNWQKTKNYNLKEFELYLSIANTYGVLCGYNNLFVIDLDSEKVQNELLQIDEFKNTFQVKTAGKGLTHFYFYTDIPPKSFKCLDCDLNTILDAQGLDKQVIGAGSQLANGCFYEPLNDFGIKFVKYQFLKDLLEKYNQKPNNTQKTQKITKNEENDPLLKQIKSIYTIPMLLKDVGIDTRSNPTACPLHTSVKGKCLSFTDELFHCFHCENSGNVFHLYQLIHKCNFIDALNALKEKTGMSKKIEQEAKKQAKEVEKTKILEVYKNLQISKFVIYKSQDETIYKLIISNFKITLTPESLLAASDFRKKYFNETGYLLPAISNTKWVGLINAWVQDFGQIIDTTIETNTEAIIRDTCLNEIQSFAVVIEPKEAVSYGRLLYLQETPGFVYICNKVLMDIIKKNQFKINFIKLKLLLDDIIVGNSKVIRTGRQLFRFFKLDAQLLNDLDLSNV